MPDVESIRCRGDAKLRGLEAALDPAGMQATLDRAHADAFGERPGAGWSCRLLRYHPGARAVLLYAPECGAAPDAKPLVGKLYAKRSKAFTVWRALGALASRDGADGVWRSPRPLVLLSEWNLLLMEHLAGRALRDVVCSGEPAEREERAVRLAARALAELHRLPAQHLEARSLETDRRTLERRVRRVEALDPGLALDMARLSREIAERAARLAPCREPTFLHGSASPKQLLLEGERIAVLDFDGVARGDPALDVGTFMAGLRKYGTRWAPAARLRELAERFLEESCGLAGDASLAARARLVQAQELVNSAARSRLAGTDPEAVAARRSRLLLEETAACLA